MIKLLVTLISLAFIGLFYAFTPLRPAEKAVNNYQTEYVYVVIIDGPRFTETFGDSTYQYIPHMGKELLKEGVLLSNFRNNGPTYTNSGHAAITTGVYQHLSNGGKELPHYPSYFQYYLKEKNVSKTDAYIVTSKGKLQILSNTKNKKWWNTYMPSSFCGPNGNGAEYSGDQGTFDKVKELITGEKPPHLMLVNFLAVDSYGHSNEWKMYLKSILKCDEYVSEIWKMIQSSPKLRNKTTLIVTNDHGRHLDGHKDGFVSHGDGCEGCRHIMLLGLGPDFKKNQILNNCSEQLDISKTIAQLLHFHTPSSKGRVLNELFNN